MGRSAHDGSNASSSVSRSTEVRHMDGTGGTTTAERTGPGSGALAPAAPDPAPAPPPGAGERPGAGDEAGAADQTGTTGSRRSPSRSRRSLLGAVGAGGVAMAAAAC